MTWFRHDKAVRQNSHDLHHLILSALIASPPPNSVSTKPEAIMFEDLLRRPMKGLRPTFFSEAPKHWRSLRESPWWAESQGSAGPLQTHPGMSGSMHRGSHNSTVAQMLVFLV